MTEIPPAVIILGVIVKRKRGDLRGDFTKNTWFGLNPYPPA